MKTLAYIAIIALSIFTPSILTAQERIRFVTYNVENLFDCHDDSLTNDNAFLPSSLRSWTTFRYWNKLQAVSRALATIGENRAPDIIALCEVENDSVLHDLTHRSSLRSIKYKYLITNSSAPRGIDIGLLYKPTSFRPTNYCSLRPTKHIPKGSNMRDLLYVSGTLVTGDTLDLIACHLPSRLNGRKATHLRRNAVEYIRQVVDSIIAIRSVPRIIVMGDFNDTSYSKALRPLVENKELVCITDALSGSYRHQGHWQQIDHIFISSTLLDTTRSPHLSPHGAWLSLDTSLIEPDPIYGGYRPRRTYNGMRYVGGTSDHLPVCFDLIFDW